MRKENFTIQLTEDKACDVHLELGRGDFSIGTLEMDAKKNDILIDANLQLRWKAFEEMSDEGDWWPRYFNYFGNDTGFAEWSKKRNIESFSWYPQKEIKLKDSEINIRHLIVNVDKNTVDLDLHGQLLNFTGSGNLANLRLDFGSEIPRLNFIPSLSKEQVEPYSLPVFKNLAAAEHLDISVDVLKQPFDCESLLQFPNLTSLSLSGNLTNLACLTKLDKLQSLAVRFVPNLESFPSLSSWKHLKSFIGWNIEEIEGKRLRKEVKLIKSDTYSNVSQLRKSTWFVTEYGMPFADWETKNEKKAVKNYKSTLKQINKAKTIDEVKEAIGGFVTSINALDNIETSEREDVATAVSQLAASAKIHIDEQLALRWFDEVRDF